MFINSEILLIKDFRFNNGSIKDKFMIVLCSIDDNILFSSLPSSQVYVSPENIKPGCIFISHGESGNTHIYHFPEGKPIGRNSNFSFRKDTFVYIPRGTLELNKDKLESYSYESKDLLLKEQYINLISCMIKGGSLRKKYIPMLEGILEKLNE